MGGSGAIWVGDVHHARLLDIHFHLNLKLNVKWTERLFGSYVYTLSVNSVRIRNMQYVPYEKDNPMKILVQPNEYTS